MAPLPKSFSLQAVPIKAALSEGRTEDAKTMVCDLLRAGKADAVVQGLAADLLKPAKRGRGRQKALPWRWLDIAEHFREMREDDGLLYEDALRLTAERFGRSESHVRTCITTYESAKEDVHRE